MKLYYHPLSSYSQKKLMAFYEKGCGFEPVLINLMDEKGKEDYKKIYPMGKVPKYKNVSAYMNRLAERPSFQRVLQEAAPYLAAFKK